MSSNLTPNILQYRIQVKDEHNRYLKVSLQLGPNTLPCNSRPNVPRKVILGSKCEQTRPSNELSRPFALNRLVSSTVVIHSLAN